MFSVLHVPLFYQNDNGLMTLVPHYGMKRIDNVGRQTFINKESRKIVIVVPGSFRPCFYFREIRVSDKAVVLILGNINASEVICIIVFL